jgi:hypothetical protein
MVTSRDIDYLVEDNWDTPVSEVGVALRESQCTGLTWWANPGDDPCGPVDCGQHGHEPG